MPTRQKTSKSGNRRVSSIKPESAFLKLDSMLTDVGDKLERLELKYAQKPSDQLYNLIKQYQEQVIGLEQQMATLLRDDPTLSHANRSSPLQSTIGYKSEENYRSQLSREQDKLEAELMKELRAEQDKREQEWRQAERARIEQREHRLLEMLAERQAKVEDEWQLRRKTDSAASAFVWFSEQQKELREQLQAGMQKLRQDFDTREQAHVAEVRRELAQLEREWSEKRRKELQKLEVEWREQEIMHRERAYLRRMEGEWRAEQHANFEQSTLAWRAEFEQVQTQKLAAHITEVLPKVFKEWAEQFAHEQDGKSRALFKQAKAEWDGLLHEKLRKDLDQTIASLRKEVDQRLSSEITSNMASLTTSYSESLKITQRDYTALAAAWEKKHADALQAQKELWQSQQKKLLTETTSEMKTSAQMQLQQMKTVFESQMTQVMSNMFKQWSLQFTEEQAGNSKATFKQIKSEWDLLLRESLKRETEALQNRNSEAARLLQSQNEQFLTSAQNKLEQTLTANVSECLKSLKRDYNLLANEWEKQHAAGLKVSSDLWQSQQKKFLAELSSQIKLEVETQGQQLKSSMESHTSSLVPEIFNQWAQQF